MQGFQQVGEAAGASVVYRVGAAASLPVVGNLSGALLGRALLVSTAPDHKVLKRGQHTFEARNPFGECADLLTLAPHLGADRSGSDDNGAAETDGCRDDGDKFS